MILVIGGAGYIGSHFIEELIREKDVVILDNLSTGHYELLNNSAIFIEGDLGNTEILISIFDKYSIEAVVHFAASSLVGESVVNPQKYYENNVISTINLLNTMLDYDIKNFIFSSTAAVYGTPEDEFLTEESLVNPINPYGRSKLMIEWILDDYSRSYGLNYVVLRYFNAAGAHPDGRIGEQHDPETHLIPIVLQHLLGERNQITIFGSDYPTEDGTCIRDYVHVTDLAKAHLLSLRALLIGELKTEIFNLGNGSGYSVMDIIRTCEEVTGKRASIVMSERRSGDPARLVASALKIEQTLGWKPQYDLVDVIETAWKWHSNNAIKDK